MNVAINCARTITASQKLQKFRWAEVLRFRTADKLKKNTSNTHINTVSVSKICNNIP